jgi:hypothetical protein
LCLSVCVCVCVCVCVNAGMCLLKVYQGRFWTEVLVIWGGCWRKW